MKRIKISSRLLRDENGQSLIIVAAAMIVLLGIAAFTVDLGFLFYQKRHLQNTADAAALAAVKELPNEDEVQSEAEKYARLHNVNNEEDGTVVEATLYENTNEVEVYVKKEYGRFFGSIWSNEPYTVSAVARAKYDPRIVGVAPFMPLPRTYEDEWEGWVGFDEEDYGEYDEPPIPNRVHMNRLIGDDYYGSSLEDFYNYVKIRIENDDIRLGLLHNLEGDWDSTEGPRGYINIDPDIEQNPGVDAIRTWLAQWGEDEILGIGIYDGLVTIAGLKETIPKDPGNEDHFDYFLEYVGEAGYFYILLPHPDFDIDHPHTLVDDFLIAKVKIDIGDNLPGDDDKSGFYYSSEDIADESSYNNEDAFIEAQDYILGAKLIDVYWLDDDDDWSYLVGEGVITGVVLTR